MARRAPRVALALTLLFAAATTTALASEPARAEACDGWPLAVATPGEAGLLEASLGQLRVDHPLAGIAQLGDVTNCGPTAAAMLLAEYVDAGTAEERRALQEAIGRWSWEAFPLRQAALPGHDPGMTTLGMMRATTEALTDAVRLDAVAHPWIPGEAWSIIALKRALLERRPLLALVQLSTLWGARAPGLHWIVVRGLDDGAVIYNDPADGVRSRVPFDQFWRAWRLNDIYRRLPLGGSFAALAPDRPLPVRSLARDAPELGPAVAR